MFAMERKGLRKRDILRIDGLLPPTRRLPVCDAVSGTPDKKKDKKWSIGGILRRISSMRDYDSSSNDEEIVYCKRTPRKASGSENGRANPIAGEIVLHSLENDQPRVVVTTSNVRQLADSSPHFCRDSLHSRSSDGSLDGLNGLKKNRRNQLKARAEAKRDHLCAESSSDDECHRSNSSLNRLHGATRNEDVAAHNGQQRNNACGNRKTRAARTERYIKRLSRDDGNGSGDSILNDTSYNRRCCSLEHNDQHNVVLVADVTNGSCRPPVHPRRFGLPTSDRALPVRRSLTDDHVDPAEIGSEDRRRYSTGQYVTDVNRNNAYGKISCRIANADADDRRAGNFFTYPAKNACHYAESLPFDRRRLDNLDNRPPEPPPRDPRYRVYGYGSYPANRHQNVPSYFGRQGYGINAADGRARVDRSNFRSYGSNNEIARYDRAADREMENTSPCTRTESRDSSERTNNEYNSSHWPIESAYGEAEAARCRYRNTRNDRLDREDGGAHKAGNKSASIREPSKHRETTVPSRAFIPPSDWSRRGRSACEQHRHPRSVSPSRLDVRAENDKREERTARPPTDQESSERRRSSRNLEEALSELEAIYNSLRLGDEDLLDRAERRSMEEYSLKQQGRNELDAVTAISSPDSPDRTKDDMAYRRMHPKERPTSLSDVSGQSTLSRISYLIASPVLSLRDSADDPAHPCRRDEPDVTRDDVVFRSMNHANNTLRVIDPQPPFGIPLGPVTAATESDYLHTTPTKPEQPRSPYIPQCEPDVVTDDLAYRTLRKDAIATRNVAQENRIDKAAREERQRTTSGTLCDGTKKKRAVRSLSANLYGLIDHERIHLRREPSLDAIRDEIQDVTPERSAHLRRVVSDGELSDGVDARRRKEPDVVAGDSIDINGNRATTGAYRRKLCDSPEMPTTAVATPATRENPKKEKKPNMAGLSRDTVRSSGVAALDGLDDEFWHEYLRSDSDVLATDDGDRATETDFTAYSRLCQDLVNLIKGDEEATPADESAIGSPSVPDDSVVAGVPVDGTDSLEIKTTDVPLTNIDRSVGSHCSRSQRHRVNNDEQKLGDESAGNENTEGPAAESTSARDLDFYLRVADENVKLIAEAFSSVADHLRDSRLSARESSSASRNSEAECQSGSTRSSILHSQDDRMNDDDRLRVVSPAFGDKQQATIGAITAKREPLASNEGDQDDRYSRSESTSTAELDLSRAVRDLQLAAADLCQHGREIESLGTGRGWNGDARVASSLSRHDDDDDDDDDDEAEEDHPTRKLGLIADALRQQQGVERDREHVDRATSARCDENGPRAEKKCRGGERTVCRELGDRARSRCVERNDARSRGGTRVPGVTNITNEATITKCSMLLLACLLALLLAIVAAS